VERYGHVHLDELESLPGPGTLTWRPVRAHFDIRAFGTNAYHAETAGADVVEPHTESTDDGYRHEELYFVARGSARFTLDDETFTAPAGTYVFIRDPEVHRHAVAEEDGTTVLSFGGPPTFTPSAWEWSFRASGLRKQGDREGARAVLEEGRATYPGSAGLLYELACFEATGGNLDAARAALDGALAIEPKLERWIAEDEELAALS
jgi:AraC-like ligand binding domain